MSNPAPTKLLSAALDRLQQPPNETLPDCAFCAIPLTCAHERRHAQPRAGCAAIRGSVPFRFVVQQRQQQPQQQPQLGVLRLCSKLHDGPRRRRAEPTGWPRAAAQLPGSGHLHPSSHGPRAEAKLLSLPWPFVLGRCCGCEREASLRLGCVAEQPRRVAEQPGCSERCTAMDRPSLAH